MVLFSPPLGEIKAGWGLPGTASFRVIRVFRGPLRLPRYVSEFLRKHVRWLIKFPVVLALLFLIATSDARAGLVGWLTSSACSWNTVQQTGGIRIGEPLEKEGRLVLPVEYDASGVTGVNRHPNRINSGLVVRKISTSRIGNGRIVIRVVTQVAEKSSDTGRMHYADLENFPPGAHSVYYGDADDPDKLLGQIRVK